MSGHTIGLPSPSLSSFFGWMNYNTRIRVAAYPRTDRRHFLFLNIGHFLDHFFLLIFAIALALALIYEWDLTYGELIPYSTASAM